MGFPHLYGSYNERLVGLEFPYERNRVGGIRIFIYLVDPSEQKPVCYFADRFGNDGLII